MRKLVIGASLAAGLLIPASAMGNSNPARKAARQACIAERHAIGGQAFRVKYGAHGALQACIVRHGGGAPNPKPHPRPHPHPHPGGGDHNQGGGDHKRGGGDHRRGGGDQRGRHGGDHGNQNGQH